MSLSPPVLQELFLLHHVVVCFVGGLGWPNRVFRESCHQDVPWVHASTISSILRMLVCFVTMAIALSSLLGHWGALSLRATISAVAKTGPIWKEDRCWRGLRKIGKHIRKKKQTRSCSYSGQGWKSNRGLNNFQRSGCKTASSIRKYKVPSSRSAWYFAGRWECMCWCT